MQWELLIFGLALLLLVIGALLVWRQMAKRQHDRLALAVKKMGGTFRATDTGMRKKVTAIDLHGSLVDNAGLAQFADVRSLEYLDLSGTKVTDPGLKHLQGLKRLQGLKLASTKVTDAGLEHLKGLNKLQTLDLHLTKVTDAGVEQFQGALPQTKIKR
jgi:hypothetical protein